MYELMISPEQTWLAYQLMIVKQLLAQALGDYDEIQLHQIPAASAKYLQIFGELERDIFEAELNLQKIQLRIRLVRQYLNRAQTVDLNNIDQKIIHRFHEFDQELADRNRKLKEASDYFKLPLLTTSESKLLTQLYKKLVKVLHPDLHPQSTDAQLRLFQLATNAYENGDIKILQQLLNVVDTRSTSEIPASLAELARLKHDYQEMVAKINQCFSEWPLVTVPLVSSPSLAALHMAHLKDQLTLFQNKNAALNIEYGKLVGDLGREKID